jgi:hypothetical protein
MYGGKMLLRSVGSLFGWGEGGRGGGGLREEFSFVF